MWHKGSVWIIDLELNPTMKNQLLTLFFTIYFIYIPWSRNFFMGDNIMTTSFRFHCYCFPLHCWSHFSGTRVLVQVVFSRDPIVPVTWYNCVRFQRGRDGGKVCTVISSTVTKKHKKRLIDWIYEKVEWYFLFLNFYSTSLNDIRVFKIFFQVRRIEIISILVLLR